MLTCEHELLIAYDFKQQLIGTHININPFSLLTRIFQMTTIRVAGCINFLKLQYILSLIVNAKDLERKKC
jgi:hypothetical protein